VHGRGFDHRIARGYCSHKASGIEKVCGRKAYNAFMNSCLTD
jgi:hypothetical protein